MQPWINEDRYEQVTILFWKVGLKTGRIWKILFRVVDKTNARRLTTHEDGATPRSQTTSAGAVYHARLERDSLIEMRGSRYKAGMSWS